MWVLTFEESVRCHVTCGGRVGSMSLSRKVSSTACHVHAHVSARLTYTSPPGAVSEAYHQRVQHLMSEAGVMFIR